MKAGHGEDDPAHRLRVVAYVDAAAEWIEGLPGPDSEAVARHLYGRTARQPRAALSVEPGVFHTFVPVARGKLRGFRIDYSITELAVVVLGGRPLYRQG